jgi:hypothetical protein
MRDTEADGSGSAGEACELDRQKGVLQYPFGGWIPRSQKTISTLWKIKDRQLTGRGVSEGGKMAVTGGFENSYTGSKTFNSAQTIRGVDTEATGQGRVIVEQPTKSSTKLL